MSQELVQGLTDVDLVEAAKAGDQQAFADLYTRYFDPIYDFILRMTRNRDEAADLAQDTFIKAMNSLPGLQTGASFKSWIYTIARNTTLNRLERASRIRPLAVEDSEGEEVTFDVVDTDRFGSPEEAAEASALATLVWEAAQGLDAKQLTLLDLHLRQGLESAGIAEVMGVTKNNGYVMLNRLKKAVEEAIGAYIMLNDGRKYCTTLDTALDRAGIGSMTPEVRKLVEKHVAQCDQCTERKKKLVSPLAVFGAFVPVTAPAGLREGILGEVMRQWPLPPGTGTGLAADGGSAAGYGGGAGGAGGGAGAVATGAAGGGWFSGRLRNIAIGGGSLAAVLGVLLFVPASPFALNNGGGGDLPAAPIVVEPATQTPSPSPSATPTDEDQPSATPTPAPADTATPTPEVAAPGESTETPTPPPTAAAVAPTQPGSVSTPPTATATPSPRPSNTPVPSATNTPRPTNTPMPTPTAFACVPALGSNVSNVNAGSRTSAQFTLLNLGNCSVDVIVTNQGGHPWLSVAPTTATLAPSGSITVNITIVRALVPAGGDTGTVLVVTQGAATQVTVSVDGPPTPTPTNTPLPTNTPTPTSVPDTQAPVISAMRACFPPSSFGVPVTVRVSGSDNVGVNSVTASDGVQTQTLLLASGTAQNGVWERTFQLSTPNNIMFTVTMTDSAGNSTSDSAVATGSC